MRPVGLSWGNDEGYKPSDQAAGKKLKQSTISDQIPGYAKTHLGWAGRTNGPVDNPISGCLSCHGTAQYPVAAALFPADSCTDTQRLQWFRNFKGTKAFGAMNGCVTTTPGGPLAPLDFSLQMQVAVQSVKQFNNINPCTPSGPSPAAVAASPAPTGKYKDAPRVER
jgi:hypothetical protein